MLKVKSIKYRVISLNLSLIFVLSLGVLGFTGALTITKSTAAVNTGERLLPIYSVKTDEKTIAITFDAAWSDSDTDELMEILKKYNAKATFFCVGDYIEKYPEAVKIFYENGHEIGNHSDTHKTFTDISREEVRKELVDCNKKIEQLIGKAPTICRAPSGAYDNKSIEIAESLNMKMIQWDCDSRDWQKLSVEKMVKNVTVNASNGSIILFHNGVENTPEALDKVLNHLSNEGYSFVTVSRLIYKDNYTIDHTGTQIKKGL